MMAAASDTIDRTWRDANWRYVKVELDRLRIVLRRRILWLREEWKNDPLQQHHGLVISDEKADHLLISPDARREEEFFRKDVSAIALGKALTQAERKLELSRNAFAESGRAPAI